MTSDSTVTPAVGPAATPTGRIGLRTDGMVRWLIFDQPAKHNALSMGMIEEALDAVRAFSDDGGQRVLVLTGGGDRAFVSGGDLAEFERGRDADEAERRYLALAGDLFEAVADCPKPTIAAIHGYCFGGGVALAAACDLRYAADDAQFCIPSARLGLAFPLTFVRWMVDLIGPAPTREMLYTGRRYDSAEADGFGLVNRVYAKAALDAEVARIAGTIADNAPMSVRAAKETIGYLLGEPAEAGRIACEEAVAACANSRDFAEGRAAFAEKRKPVFEGR
ncbi:MAG: enoyl-CoA hydratase [Rhodospirillaceae bacterium]|nr:enoyl-CoA hydratase [Rhodospirillaceae bacterium]MDE0618299.1 enoyl-CoA hydratase [Rhodospirillaceae bacterium]